MDNQTVKIRDNIMEMLARHLFLCPRGVEDNNDEGEGVGDEGTVVEGFLQDLRKSVACMKENLKREEADGAQERDESNSSLKLSKKFFEVYEKHDVAKMLEVKQVRLEPHSIKRRCDLSLEV
eukprot:765514-Hanusia_phi.AAC.1